ncbi:hypothetical protein [Methylomonas sp. HYX-M1]|uniref:hypothetical protein n=1 Tax=Methylomonas sp. HYX-M1 TaxID=3139307 RepID=UPI00345BA499
MNFHNKIISLINVIVLVFFYSANYASASGRGYAKNLSYPTACAEEDNINVPIYASHVGKFLIKANHPKYLTSKVTASCHEDFSGCTTAALLPSNSSTASSSQKIFDNGQNVFWLYTETNWWRAQTMSVKINGVVYQGHRLELNKKINKVKSWPVVMVIYQDGYMRLKPHPPIRVRNDQGVNDTCFGSSVIMGPAIESLANPPRPFVDIEEIVIVDPVTPCLDISYRDGGSAHLCVSVNRSKAVATITPEYDLLKPFVTLRSMWVSDGNSDVDHLNRFPIATSPTKVYGSKWNFRNKIKTKHNTSAPNISIIIK